MQYWILIMIIGLIGLDQVTKYWSVSTLSNQADILLWPNVLHLTYVENRGAAFGILQNRQWFFVLIAMVAIGVVVYYWRTIPNNLYGKWAKFALGLIISGAIGNMIDRIMLGYVIDMIYFVPIDFPVFNVADICVVVGTAILMPIFIWGDIESKEDNE